MPSENTNNAPIRVDNDPFVGQVNQEYKNSADITGRPISPTTGPKVALYDSAKAAEAKTTVITGVYGSADYELDENGERKDGITRMGSLPGVNKLVDIPANTTDGTFVISVDGDETTVNWNQSTATFADKLNALSTVEGATVTGTAGDNYTLALPGTVDSVTIVSSNLTPVANVTVADA